MPEIAELYNSLKQKSKHKQLIKLLQEYKLSEELSLDETAWVYWNISDRYAMLQDPMAEYANHCEFFDWSINNLNADKYHWITSDATQALTLTLGGFQERWMEWYDYALNSSAKNPGNFGVRFESHRATAAILNHIKNHDTASKVYKNWEKLLGEMYVDSEYYKLAYLTSILEYYHLLGKSTKADKVMRLALKEMENVAMKWMELPDNDKRHLPGSWKDMNAIRHSKKSLLVAINNLGCKLGISNYHEECITVFELVKGKGHLLNSYAERILTEAKSKA